MPTKIYVNGNHQLIEKGDRIAPHATKDLTFGLPSSGKINIIDKYTNTIVAEEIFSDFQNENGSQKFATKQEAIDYFSAFSDGGGNGSGVTDSLIDRDYWYESIFTQSSTPPQYLTSAVSGAGTVTFGEAEARINFPFNAQVTTSTSNGQVSWIAGGTLTGSSANGYPVHFNNNVNELYFVIPSAILTQRKIRTGILNSVVLQSAVANGVYIEINDLVASAICVSASTSTTHATTVTLSTLKMYRALVSLNSNNTEARFQIFEFENTTPIWDVVITTNIPSGTVGISHRIVAGGVGATPNLSPVVYLYKFNYGTKNARKRLTGRE